jgi:hypothetical protein
MNYSLQANRKTTEGQRHPDRNAQFEYINQQVRSYQRRGQPVISVDTKKKENVGDFKNWRGKPLIDLAAIVNLVGSTKTKEGLKIRCELDTKTYPKGIKVSDALLEKVKLKKHKFHGDWNYTIYPNKKSESN